MKKYEGKLNMAMGVTKQKLGELTGNRNLEREGQMQKIKGVTQDATENAKAVAKGVSQEVVKQSRKGAKKLVKDINQTFAQTNVKAQSTVREAGNKLEATLIKIHQLLK